jgi:hypothetical protein
MLTFVRVLHLMAKRVVKQEQMKQHFPMEFISSDYCYLSPTIQFPQASIVTLHVKFTFISIIF